LYLSLISPIGKQPQPKLGLKHRRRTSSKEIVITKVFSCLRFCNPGAEGASVSLADKFIIVGSLSFTLNHIASIV
ncbi:hypothetical protein LINPERPRIM_LOCUS15788, partial [Linum perenne]